jgi:DNA polymerase I-like protein with 3'-5' exonuclease and polymerase domains
MGNSKDEIQVACRNKEVAEIVLKATKEAMTNVQHMFGFRTQLDVEGKIGANWYECH